MSWVTTFYKKTGNTDEEGPLDRLLTVVIWYCVWVSLIILFIGVVGNATICYIIVRTKAMRTSVNYFLFSLALADILNSITWLVFATIWLFQLNAPAIQEAVWNLHDAITSVDSNLTLTALTINRYIAICYPLKARYIATHSRTIKIITAIWIFSFMYYASYHLLMMEFCESKEDTFCNTVRFLFSDNVYIVLIVVTPMATITVLYTLIALTIRRSSQMSVHQQTQRQVSARRGLKLSIAVILEFFICSIPCQLVQISAVFFPNFLSTTTGHALFFFTKLLNLVSTVVDPIVYSLVSTKFRKAFQDLYHPSGKEATSMRRTEITFIDSNSAKKH